MVINTTKEQLLGLIQTVIGVVEKRNTTPILGNILFHVANNQITLTATDTEIEIQASDIIEHEPESRFTVPGRKIFDIVKSLPDQSALSLNVMQEKVHLESGSFAADLYIIDASNFPDFQTIQTDTTLKLPENELSTLINAVQFAMGNQDARYFLNGMLVDLMDHKLRVVATDGHRMGLRDSEIELPEAINQQYIIPRKAVIEINRLLGDHDRMIDLKLGQSALQLSIGDVVFSARLIDGKYPDYNKAIPTSNPHEVIVDKKQLRSALQRAMILADERRAVRLKFDQWKLSVESTSNEQDQAQEVVEINYEGDAFETGFNLSYILDVLNVIESDVVHMYFKDGASTCLIKGSPAKGQYMISPMRI